MGFPTKPNPVKLFVGAIFQEETHFEKAYAALSKKFGPLDFKSALLDFNQTNYYEKEMGEGLKRQFFSFKRLVPPEKLVVIKLTTNALEKKLSFKNAKRTINLDPGYISLSKVVLATTKSFSHRIYIGRGIYEEITLIFQKGSFNPTIFTYPDFRTDEYIQIFNNLRQNYYKTIESQYGSPRLPYCV
jgi:hypothetical protein